MTSTEPVCKKKDCNVGATGKCALGHDPVEVCEFFNETEVTELDQISEDQIDEMPEEVVEDYVALDSNDALNESDLSILRNAVRAKVVVLIGEQDAGKTTLLATLYGLLCKGPIGKFRFAGSKTLLAFAERHHLALLKSKRQVPTTPRTSRSVPVRYFHLSLLDEENRTELVISDRSGEHFDDARINTDLISELTELSISDRICFLLDVEKVTNDETRAGYKRSFKQLIRALLDNNAILEKTNVEILATKIDKLAGLDGAWTLPPTMEDFRDELISEFSLRFNSFQFNCVCALPKANHEVGCVGVQELLDRWCEAAPTKDTSPLAVRETARHFNRMLNYIGE